MWVTLACQREINVVTGRKDGRRVCIRAFIASPDRTGLLNRHVAIY